MERLRFKQFVHWYTSLSPAPRGAAFTLIAGISASIILGIIVAITGGMSPELWIAGTVGWIWFFSPWGLAIYVHWGQGRRKAPWVVIGYLLPGLALILAFALGPTTKFMTAQMAGQDPHRVVAKPSKRQAEAALQAVIEREHRQSEVGVDREQPAFRPASRGLPEGEQGHSSELAERLSKLSNRKLVGRLEEMRRPLDPVVLEAFGQALAGRLAHKEVACGYDILGAYYGELGDKTRALAARDREVVVYQELLDAQGVGNSELKRAHMLLERPSADYSECMKSLDYARRAFLESGSSLDLMFCDREKAHCIVTQVAEQPETLVAGKRAQMLEMAIGLCERTLEDLGENGDLELRGDCNFTLSLALRENDDFDGAIDAMQMARKLYERRRLNQEAQACASWVRELWQQADERDGLLGGRTPR